MSMRYKLFALVCALCLATSQYISAQKSYKIAVGFYNLENLFDTIDNENDDEDFLPTGSYGWTEERYQSKLSNMAYAISQLAGGQAPDILGLCELENRHVLEDLIAHPTLAPLGYEIVHFDSPDKRGIDVALIYRPKVLTLTGATPHSVHIPNEEYIKTRDILEVNGRILGESFSLLVGHWPSRSGGEQISLNRRMAAAKVMRAVTDSLQAIRPNEKLILMGDFNDDPISPSLTEGLRSINSEKNLSSDTDLYNVMAKLHKTGYGTLAYRDVWNLFDNIVVSANLIAEGKGWHLLKNKSTQAYGRIYNAPFLTQATGHYKGYPFRTTSNGQFQNGYSDHYPVYVYLVKKVN